MKAPTREGVKCLRVYATEDDSDPKKNIVLYGNILRIPLGNQVMTRNVIKNTNCTLTLSWIDGANRITRYWN